jgi:aldehyde dehydrogenase (NAD(P)+)
MTELAVDSTVDWAASIDAALARLHRNEKAWAETALARRCELLEQLHTRVGKQAQAWVDAAAGLKGLDPTSPLVGEEWISGPYAMLNGLCTLAESVAALQKGGSPVDGYRIGTAPGGRVTVDVLPHTVYDRLLLSGFSAQVWMKPGVSAQTARRAWPN